MNDADALIAFLNARLDEDVEVAQAACWDDQSDVWTASPPRERYEQYIVEDYLGDGVVVVTPENADDDGVGQHIARHDPARALREVAAKRQQIAHYQRVAERAGQHLDYELAAGACRTALRHMAVAYAEHPDYQQEWTP